MKCTGKNKAGKPCGNDAEPDSDRCPFHPREAAGGEPTPPPSPTPPPPGVDAPTPPPPTPPPVEPAAAGLPADLPPDFFQLPEAPPPELEPGAVGGVAPAPPPPGAIAGSDDAAGGTAGTGDAAGPPPPELPPLAAMPEPAQTGPAPARFQWKGTHLRPLLAGPVNAMHGRIGITPLSPEEINAGADVLAPCIADLMAQVDPNSPWGTASLWVLMTYGPRFVGRAVAHRAEAEAVPPPPTPGGVQATGALARLIHQAGGGARA